MTPEVAVDPGERVIADFYDRHPYPPPVVDLDRHAAAWADGTRRRIEHHRIWPRSPFRDDHRILVAGCGTSQAARYAVAHPNSTVVGIDVSEVGLAHHESLRDRHDLANLELRLLPIEEVATIGSTFDHVVCTGVLHHLADPDAGLAALRSVLAPGGALVAMVYAAYGRTGVAMIQDYCRRLGVDTSAAEIDDLVATLREIPTGHPLSHLLRGTPDFRRDDALADALLNPRERSYTVPELFAWLARSGLRFQRWLRQAPYDPRCGSPSETPHAARIDQLDPGDRDAAMELLRGTITRHSVIATRDDEPVDAQRITFVGDEWRRFVPIPEPTLTIVEERLPVGAAAALLNRAHQHTDLVMFVDESDRRVLDSIDGVRTAGELALESPEFLERLWRHDLVVVDASSFGAASGDG